MKHSTRLTLLFLALFAFFTNSFSQPPRTVYNESFGWTITIPEGFEAVEKTEVDAMRKRGYSKIEEVAGQKIESQSTPIFTFRSDASHYIEANSLSVSFSKEEYIAEYKAGYDIIYKTFGNQFLNHIIDTIQSTAIIDSLEFQMFKLQVDLGKFDLNILMYSRLFGNRYFSVNIMYMDYMVGKKMIDAWKESKFAWSSDDDTSVTYVAKAQTSPSRQLYNNDFDWAITIPENFEIVSEEKIKAMEKRGLDALENTVGQKIVDETKKIFIFSRGPQNYFESRYQPYDNKDDDYLQVCVGVNNMLYETFQNQFPESTIDTVHTTEKIDGLEFQVFKLDLYINQATMHAIMYSGLFGEKELIVSLIYLDESTGKEMLEAWKGSKFGKK